jgi:hypothetical protein
MVTPADDMAGGAHLRDFRIYVAGAAVAIAIAGASAVAHGPDVWAKLGRERERDAALTPEQRERAFLDALPLPANVFDFYRAYLRPGDRLYFQVLESGFGQFADLPTVVATVGRYYLLPAVAVERLEDANVVISWEADPGLLGVEFEEQHRAGLQLFFVSRIRR